MFISLSEVLGYEHHYKVECLFYSGEVLGFENLVYSVFEFVHALIDTSRFRNTVKGTIDQIIYYIIIYMQMTEDQVTIFLSHFHMNSNFIVVILIN